MKKIYTIIISFILTHSFAQKNNQQYFTPYYIANLGYTYQNINYAELGANIYLVKPNNNILDIGTTINIGAHHKIIIIPEVQIGYLWNLKKSTINPYSENINSPFYISRISISPWHITPETGITLLNFMDLTIGYGFEFRENKHINLNGFKIGMNIKLPFSILNL